MIQAETVACIKRISSELETLYSSQVLTAEMKLHGTLFDVVNLLSELKIQVSEKHSYQNGCPTRLNTKHIGASCYPIGAGSLGSAGYEDVKDVSELIVFRDWLNQAIQYHQGSPRLHDL